MRYINWEDPFGLNCKESAEERIEDFAITLRKNNVPHRYDGESEETQQMNTQWNEVLGDPETSAVARTYKVFSNYSQAKDSPFNQYEEDFHNFLRWF